MKNEKWDDVHGNTTPDDRMVAFLESPTDSYAILQLREDVDDNIPLMFANYSYLQKKEMEPEIDRYEVVYHGSISMSEDVERLPVGRLVFSGQISPFLRSQQTMIVAEVVNTSGCVLQCELIPIDLIKAWREVECPLLCVGYQHIIAVPQPQRKFGFRQQAIGIFGDCCQGVICCAFRHLHLFAGQQRKTEQTILFSCDLKIFGAAIQAMQFLYPRIIHPGAADGNKS